MTEEDKEGESVYNEKAREKQLEDDELSPEEEAFMKGYDEANEEKKKKETDEEEEEKEE